MTTPAPTAEDFRYVLDLIEASLPHYPDFTDLPNLFMWVDLCLQTGDRYPEQRAVLDRVMDRTIARLSR